MRRGAGAAGSERLPGRQSHDSVATGRVKIGIVGTRQPTFDTFSSPACHYAVLRPTPQGPSGWGRTNRCGLARLLVASGWSGGARPRLRVAAQLPVGTLGVDHQHVGGAVSGAREGALDGVAVQRSHPVGQREFSIADRLSAVRAERQRRGSAALSSRWRCTRSPA